MSSEKTAAEEALKGVVGIYTDPDGHVIASVSEFETHGYGGFTLLQAQEHRAHQALARAVVQAYASERLWKALDGRCSEILNRLCRDGGKATFIPVGHGERGHE